MVCEAELRRFLDTLVRYVDHEALYRIFDFGEMRGWTTREEARRRAEEAISWEQALRKDAEALLTCLTARRSS